MKITLELLIEHKACEEQRELFAQTFPRGATVNARNLAKALKAGLDVSWMENLLTKTQRKDYKAKLKPLYEDYYAKCDILREDYRAKHTALYEDYYAKCDTLREDYKAKHAKLLITYFED